MRATVGVLGVFAAFGVACWLGDPLSFAFGCLSVTGFNLLLR